MDGAQITPEQAEELQRSLSQTRTMRIREAMFPETLVDAGNAYILTTQLYPGHTTAVQKLSEPAVALKHAVINLINYQEDNDVAMMACPELIALLQDEDPATHRRAASLVHQLARKQACRHAFAQNEHLVPILVKISQTTYDNDLLADVCGALQHISRCEPGAFAIYRYGGIPALVRLLDSPTEVIVNYAITTLRNLLLFVDEAKPAVRLCGGIQKMVDLLKLPSPKFLAVDVDCLQLLAFNNQESKLIILAAGGPPELVHILNNYDYEKLLFCTARLLKVLSVCTSNKPSIVEAKGMNALARHLNSPSSRVMMACLWTLRNLSDQAFLLEDLDDLLIGAIQLLSHTDPHVVTCCAGILCNLSCQNVHNKVTVVTNGGVAALVRTLMDYSEREEVTEPVICALRHVTHRHERALQALQDFANCRAMPVVAQLGAPGVSRWPLLKALVGLVRNLATIPGLRQEMKSLDVLSSLAQLLLRSHTTQDKRASINSVASSYIEGVRMDDMVEGCLAALSMLARDLDSRQMIRQLDLVPLIVQMLYSESEYLQRAACSLLYEISADPEGVLCIEGEGASATLTQLLHARNEAVATYAAAILYRLSADKSSDYRKRLSLELTESLQPRNSGYDLNSPPPLYNGGTLGGGGTLGRDQTTVLDDQPIHFGLDTNGRPVGDGHYAGDFPFTQSQNGGLDVQYRGGTLGGGSVNAAFQGSSGNLSAGYRTTQSHRGQEQYFTDMDL